MENLSYQVRLDEERLLSQQVNSSDRCVTLIIKRPLIALRYRLPDGQVHPSEYCALSFALNPGF